jgi:cell division protein FtsL
MAVAAPARARRPVQKTARPKESPARTTAPADRRLRVVSDQRIAAAKRRRAVRFLALAVGAVMMGALFALAAFHAMLASGQAELDTIEERVSAAQARYEQLRLDVAELEAPSRIVREAQERLGMVPPPDVTYLTPSEAVTAEVGQAAALDRPLTDSEAGDRAAWAAVKPYLSGRP